MFGAVKHAKRERMQQGGDDGGSTDLVSRWTDRTRPIAEPSNAIAFSLACGHHVATSLAVGRAPRRERRERRREEKRREEGRRGEKRGEEGEEGADQL